MRNIAEISIKSSFNSPSSYSLTQNTTFFIPLNFKDFFFILPFKGQLLFSKCQPPAKHRAHTLSQKP